MFGPFRGASSFSEGLAPIGSGSSGYYINTSGQVTLQLPDGIYGAAFHEGLAATEDRNQPTIGKNQYYPAGFIDRAGNWVIPPQFDFCGFFHNGLAMIEVKGKRGMIDKTGKIVVAPQYDSIGLFCEGRIAFSQRGRSGFLDEHGRVVIKPIYVTVQDFSEGLAAVCMEVES